MSVSIIVAVAENGIIGRDQELPWRLPDDLKRFKALTIDHAIVMGRKTWESIGRPLPRRTSIVLTRQPGYAAPGAIVVRTPEEALAAAGDGEVVVIGGGEVYRLFLPLADRLYLTVVHASPKGDVRFPELPANAWLLVAEEHHPQDAKHAQSFTFQTLERPPASAD